MINNSKAWDKTAKDYEKFSKTITNYYGIKAVEFSGLKSDIEQKKKLKVLDVACGPGELDVHIANLSTENKTEIFISCTDFSEEMIILASRNMNQFQEISKCVVMDGQELLFEDSSFDYAFSIFGLFFFPERKKAMKEMFRVLKNGGKGSITCWLKNPFMEVMQSTLKEMKMEVKTFPILDNKKLMAEELEGEGFKNVQFFEVEVSSKFDTMDEFFSGLISNPSVQGFVSTFSEEQCEVFYSIMRNKFAELFSEDKVSVIFPTSALIGIGEK
jgi:ubiquinone/menaquinone biosynthesis C-methylase UbiE